MWRLPPESQSCSVTHVHPLGNSSSAYVTSDKATMRRYMGQCVISDVVTPRLLRWSQFAIQRESRTQVSSRHVAAILVG
ncbi:hypothetical protein llap_10801 [Limosa lapponica baueri]|uniref:Uncharacterized protein n=1 Tax=Limosa lapponica baueri TaxID=1758121 RepID=A0A2I0TYJ4_LIMLA|nr:hypothetical protein llap_10801 [Limosa lapponica baueri]